MDEKARLSKLEELSELLTLLDKERRYNMLSLYDPGRRRDEGGLPPSAKQLEFHRLGADFRERGMFAANQSGKSTAAGFEVAIHMTGRYPDWWEGYRFNRATNWWLLGKTAEVARDNPQRILLGRGTDWGSGTVPRECLHGEPRRSRRSPDFVDGFQVLHVSGQVSTAKFKTYDQGVESLEGETLDGVWPDEEPPLDVFTALLARTSRHLGLVMLTMTPSKGATEVYLRFVDPDKEDPGAKYRVMLNMTLDDAEFYTQEEKDQIAAQYPEHERQARVFGVASLGEGLVFPISDSEISVPPFEIPDFFRHINGLDVGFGHPTAAAFVAFDPDRDIIYVYDVYKQARQEALIHAEAIKKRGVWIPVAWPHDAAQHEKGSGVPLAELYRARPPQGYGVNMLPFSARYDDKIGGPMRSEPGVQAIYDRMVTGRFKVVETCADWFTEKRMFHRKDAKIVASHDDLMKATLYACIMLRHALPYRRVQRVERAVDFEEGWI